jgi:TetR/AcrR family transcriptional regulator
MADERPRDSECTRNSVLCAAERLFAEQGFAATSMRDISQLSGISHPLIHHHFGSKNDLYAAVKRRLVEDYARRFPNAAKAANRPLNIRAEMRRLMKYIGGNPMMLRLAARTRLEGDNQAWPGEPAVLDMLSKARPGTRRCFSGAPEHHAHGASLLLVGTTGDSRASVWQSD